MRYILLSMAALVGLCSLPAPAQAQIDGFNDPFFLYYGFYVPFQANRANLPRAEDTVRAYSAQRQMTAQTSRPEVFDPFGAMGEYDPLRAFGSEGGRTPLPPTNPMGIVSLNVDGSGPAGYYNRVNTYFPTLRMGRGANQSLAPISQSPPRGRNISGGGYGLPTPYSGAPQGVRLPGR